MLSKVLMLEPCMSQELKLTGKCYTSNKLKAELLSSKQVPVVGDSQQVLDIPNLHQVIQPQDTPAPSMEPKLIPLVPVFHITLTSKHNLTTGLISKEEVTVPIQLAVWSSLQSQNFWDSPSLNKVSPVQLIMHSLVDWELIWVDHIAHISNHQDKFQAAQQLLLDLQFKLDLPESQADHSLPEASGEDQSHAHSQLVLLLNNAVVEETEIATETQPMLDANNTTLASPLSGKVKTAGVDSLSADKVLFQVFALQVETKTAETTEVPDMLTELNVTQEWTSTEVHALLWSKEDGMILWSAQITMLLLEEPLQEETQMPDMVEEDIQPTWNAALPLHQQRWESYDLLP